MYLMDFIRSLLPRLDKSDILDDISITRKELQTVVLPCYTAGADLFKVSKFKAKENAALTTVFYRNYDTVSGKKAANLVEEVLTRVPNVLLNLDYIEKELEDLMERDIIAGGLTARKAILVRGVEHMTFLSRFSMDLLSYLYSAEAKNVDTDLGDESDLSPRIVKIVAQHIGGFARMLAKYGMKPDEFKGTMVAIPDILLNETTASSMSAVYSDNKIDPLNLGGLQGFTYNPIYHLRLVIAEWQVDRYKSSQEKKKTLELRLMHLKMLQEKNHDPKLEKEISYLEARIEKYEYSMKKMEDSVR